MDEIFDVPVALQGERLDRALALLTGMTRSRVNEVIDSGRVRVGRASVSSHSRRLQAGERVIVVGGAGAGVTPPPAGDSGVPFTVVWSDLDLVVVDKPAGVVVHPGAGNPSGTLVNGLLARFPDMAAAVAGDTPAERPGVVHRLDKGTSGLLVFARTAPALASLQRQMAERTATREYLALVTGDLDSDAGIIDAPLGRADEDPVRVQVKAGGRLARTGYEVVERFTTPACCLVRCRLETGRTHQIRVHFASIGHPVVGDDRYGRRRRGSWEPLLPGRQFLHAVALSFSHPVSGERLRFESPLPPDLESALASLRAAG